MIKQAKCPFCKKNIDLEQDFSLNDLVVCPFCTSLLEIINIDPPQLDWADDPMTSPSHPGN